MLFQRHFRYQLQVISKPNPQGSGSTFRKLCFPGCPQAVIVALPIAEPSAAQVEGQAGYEYGIRQAGSLTLAGV
jgi:hypothetical protein